MQVILAKITSEKDRSSEDFFLKEIWCLQELDPSPPRMSQESRMESDMHLISSTHRLWKAILLTCSDNELFSNFNMEISVNMEPEERSLCYSLFLSLPAYSKLELNVILPYDNFDNQQFIKCS